MCERGVLAISGTNGVWCTIGAGTLDASPLALAPRHGSSPQLYSIQ